MDIIGIGALILGIVAFALSFRFFRMHKINIALVFLVLGGLILRIYAASDPYVHEWDERYHALVAKNMTEQPLKPTLYSDPVLDYNYKDWTRNHVWLHKQPLPLWTIAGSMSMFGINEFALRLPSVLLSTLAIWLTFLIGYRLFNRKTGFIAAFLFAIHGLIIELTAGRVTTDHSDVFFLFFITLAVYFAVQFSKSKKEHFNIFCGLSIGAAILSKWMAALVVVPVWIILVYDNGFSAKQIILHLIKLSLIATVVFLPWQIYIHQAFPAEATWESKYNFLHLNETVEDHSGGIFYYINKIRILFGEIIYLPLVWFIWKTFNNRIQLKKMALLLWFLAPMIVFSFAHTKMQNYIIITAPAIFIITAIFWNYLFFYRNKFKYKWLTVSILILLLALPVRYSIERIKPFKKEIKPEWVNHVKSLDFDHEKTILLNSPRPIETMFYTNCIAYRKDINQSKAKQLTNHGYHLYRYTKGFHFEKVNP
ncbi:MAG: ArnT family glycosyltransferase [Bacteroidales bacterium]